MAASASGALANARHQDLRQVASNGTATSCKTTRTRQAGTPA
jgi:hypothetical protein